MGWLADMIRTAWGFLYWNFRKTWFRARKGEGRCPCQNPSDSGLAWETGCDASHGWNRPARFRRVCPLLKPREDGTWVCSVNARDVRPFWGRAFGFYAGTAIGTYALLVLVAFGTLRIIGYHVSLRVVGWPPAWREFRAVRSDFFLAKAQTAYANQRISEAILSLSLAYEINPSNHAAGLLLAQLWQVGQVTMSDRVFERLMKEHPQQRAATAQLWYRALLARGDFSTLAQLSADGLRFDAPNWPAWMHGLLLATRKTGDLAAVERAIANPDGLPPGALGLLELERSVVMARTPQAAIPLLVAPTVGAETPYGAYYRVNRLLSLGAANEAQVLFQRLGPRMADRERIATQVDLYGALGWQPVRRATFETLLQGSVSLPVVDLICSNLLRYPDPALARQVFERLDANPLPAVAENYAGYTALFCTAGTYGDTDHLAKFAEAMKRISGSEFVALGAAATFFQLPEQERRIEAILPVLQPMPANVTYALLDRYYRPRPASP